MTVITVQRLEEAKNLMRVEGFCCDSETLEGGLQVEPDAVEWLKKNHYQLRVVETLGPTGAAVAIYPVSPL